MKFIIDKLYQDQCSSKQSSDIVSSKADRLHYNGVNTNTNVTNNSNLKQSSVPQGIQAHMGHDLRLEGVMCNASIPDKNTGFLNHAPAKFQFIGPDRAPVNINSINKCLHVADVIRGTGVPNYRQARIPLVSGLNIGKWESELRDYLDQILI